MKLKNFILALTMGLCVCAALQAKPAIGDKPKFKVKLITGKPLNIEDLRGKIVLIDFWATWCGPCMREAPHMVEIYQKYHGKGLEIIGVSMDDNEAVVKPVMAQQHFTWPMFVDVREQITGPWDISGIPQVYLIGPDGDVLWEGHPSNLDGAIEQAFKDHPPKLMWKDVEGNLVDAEKTLTAIQSAITSEDLPGALKKWNRIPAEALKNATDKTAETVRTIQTALEQYGEKELAQTQALLEQKQYDKAEELLKTLAERYGTLTTAEKARKTLATLQADPAIHAERSALTRTSAALAQAKQALAAKDDPAAYKAFKYILTQYPDSPAAVEAQPYVAKYEADKQFMARIQGNAVDSKAKSLLNMAENYRRSDRKDLARKKYQEVIDQFPNTPYAEKAKQAITEMGD
jgi:thiol-disulfide isomerase/thioredoxin/outer membrane protein assembly factor BamD (BamD/ComL family)